VSADNWEARYQARDTPWDKGEPSPGLVDFLAAYPDLPRGTVCVPGCGTGHDLKLWAKGGFDVTGYDIAPSAVHTARDKMKQEGLPCSLRQGNFLKDSPPQLFDWVFEHTFFCAIEPAQRDEYVEAVLRWLTPRGQYLAVNYLITDPDGPPYPTTREEQVSRFSPHFTLVEDWVPRSYANRAGLERMFWWQRKAR